MKNSLKMVVLACTALSSVASPAFAAPVVPAIDTEVSGPTEALMEAQCTAYLSELNSSYAWQNRTFTSVRLDDASLTFATSVGTEVGPRVIDESTRQKAPGATALSYANVSAAGSTNLHRHGGSPNMFATGYASTVTWSNTTYQFSSTYITDVLFNYFCVPTEKVVTPGEPTIIEGHGLLGHYVPKPGHNGSECDAFNDKDDTWPQWGADQAQCLWVKDADPVADQIIPGVDDIDYIERINLAKGFQIHQAGTATGTDTELNGGPATLQNQHYAVDVVVCNSPGKNPGSWRPQNLYDGGQCTTLKFNSLPSDGHFSSNSLPA